MVDNDPDKAVIPPSYSGHDEVNNKTGMDYLPEKKSELYPTEVFFFREYLFPLDMDLPRHGR